MMEGARGVWQVGCFVRGRWGPVPLMLLVLLWPVGVRGEVPCASCHEEVFTALKGTPHERVAVTEELFCRSCHGDPSQHLETGDVSGLVRGEQLRDLPPGQKAKACLGCHQGAFPRYFEGPHGREEVCWSCHETEALHFQGPKAVTATTAGRCFSCHPQVGGEFRQAYRHPVREGLVTCTSCHDVHQPQQAGEERQRCVSCHREQAGPFLFAHPPAEEGCATCHLPHGSPHRGLLASFGNATCLSCHTQSTFPAVGKVPHNYWLGGGGRCWDCHSQVHGSNVTPDFNPRGRR